MPDIPTLDAVLLADSPVLGRVAPDRLTLSPAAALARLLLRGNPAALGAAFGIVLPDGPGRTSAAGDRTALWLGPDEWLLLGPLGSLQARGVEGGAVVDIGHRQAGLLLAGPGAATVLATGCPLDLHPTTFPQGACTRTVFGKAEVILWRAGASCFHIEVARSFADYVGARLAGAIQEVQAGG